MKWKLKGFKSQRGEMKLVTGLLSKGCELSVQSVRLHVAWLSAVGVFFQTFASVSNCSLLQPQRHVLMTAN